MTRPIDILLAEDNPGDVDLTLEALDEASVGGEIHVVHNGEDALRFLLQEGEYAEAKRPDLVLLDLNLPRRTGHEVLERMRRKPEITTIPVIVLTSSDREADVCRSYELQANCYVTKPIAVQEFLGALRSIGLFWSTVVTLPSDVRQR